MKKFIYLALGAFPVLASAQNLSGFQGLLNSVGGLVRTSIPIVGGLILLVFFWGLLQFILAADDEEGRQKGRQKMIAGVIAIFVMASIWGIVAFLQNNFNVAGGNNSTNVPTVNINP